MNIAMILSGGIGRRFGSVIPKQYNLILGKPVIDYVIEACMDSELTDKILVVCDNQCIKYSPLLMSGKFDIAPNGNERYDSIENGFNYIKSNYSCDKICILDSVAPFVYGKLIDDYFEKLDENDAVITCQKITGSLGNYDFDVLNREKYYITQSPEAFRFDLISSHFKADFESTELAWQLPKNSKKYLNFDFNNNLKLTYDFDLKYAEHMINYFKKNTDFASRVVEKEDFVTKGLNNYLLRTNSQKTNEWLNTICDTYIKVAKKWDIESFVVNQSASFGVVIFAKSKTFGSVVIKLIPPFINRYKNEKRCYLMLSAKYMCKMIDFDDDCNAILLKCAKPAGYAKYEGNLALTEFFDKVTNDMLMTNDKAGFCDYHYELNEKYKNTDILPYAKKEITSVLKKAVSLYEKHFKNEQKFIIHGDLHEFNIIKDDENYIAVDPIGFYAPQEFEYTRFIRNDIFSNKAFDTKLRLTMLCEYFSRWADKRLLFIAMYIDMAFTAYNAVFENDSETALIKYFELIKILDAKIKLI